MLTKIVYNCTPDSLADITPEEFVDAFENEVRAVRTVYLDLQIEVTFNPALSSGITGFASTTTVDFEREDELRAEFKRLAEKAYEHRCTAGS